jgi:hypothetical protein
MRSRIAMIIGVGAAVCMAGAAPGQVDPIGPFTGDSSETFEGKDGGFLSCVAPNGVFDGRADLCASSAHTTPGWSGDACTIRPFVGSRLYGPTGGASTYTFNAPVAQFGGYFGSNRVGIVSGTVEFFDDQGVLIGSDTLQMRDDCNWFWHGWEISRPAERIVVTGIGGNQRVLMDAMEVVWDTGTVPCYPDCDGNETLDFFDFLCFQNAFLAQDPYADCDQNGVFDFFDFLCFQNEFLAGCP